MSKPAQPIIIELEGIRHEISLDQIENLDCRQLSENTFQLYDEHYQYQINVSDLNLNSGMCTIIIDGQFKEVKRIREIDVVIEKMNLNATLTKKQSYLNAPMPGLVNNIKVIQGQRVEKGMPLIILEAMKMENVISAPHDATIKNIHVVVGQAVEKGFPLIEFSITEG